MKYIKSFKESLLPSQFRKYTKNFNRDRYLDIFKKIGDDYEHDKNYYRVYIPLEKNENSGYISDIHYKIEKFLNDNDCKLVDYIKGQAKFNNSKNITTIGKILNRLGDQELMKLYISDEKRKSITSTEDQELYVVISRHPYDIAGSDTDRDWTNCMTIGTDKSNRLTNLLDKLKELDKDSEGYKSLKDKINNYKKNGENVKYLTHEIKEGSIISYLIKKTDKNINKPLAVLNIKPFISEKGDTILSSCNRMYGIERIEFKSVVNNILNKYFNKGKYGGKYYINKKVYLDGDLDNSRLVFDELKTEEILKMLNVKNYEIDSSGLVNIQGDVNLQSLNLNRIPIKFGNVTGNFRCYENQLTSLEGSPQKVGGDFLCFGNQLTSLEGSPQKVGGEFDCSRNKLTSLEGSPQKVGNFICSDNNLITLEGCPESVSGWFSCSRNKLTSLVYISKSIGGGIIFSDNQLTSLEGSPDLVSGNFNCSNNKLTSLEGSPRTVKGKFDCSNNKLMSLDGGPLSAKEFKCDNNQNKI